MTVGHAVRIELHSSFDSVAPDVWNRTLASGSTDVIFLTSEWQRAWWESYGRGRLVIAVIGSPDHPTAIAPWFIDGGMAFLVGSGGSDQLDVVGDTSDEAVLPAIIGALLDAEPDLVGIRCYHVPDTSPTPQRLARAATALGLRCVGEEWLDWPTLDLGEEGENGVLAADRTSLRRHERALQRKGRVTVEHLDDPSSIQPLLDAFFDQHIERWAPTSHASLFLDEVNRDFYRHLVAIVGPTGELRFTVVRLGGEPVAFHFGTNHAGRFVWYKPTFAIAHARSSPGEVLLRNLLLRAVHEGGDEFDFGIGGEAFKLRFADKVRRVHTWGVYP